MRTACWVLEKLDVLILTLANIVSMYLQSLAVVDLLYRFLPFGSVILTV